MIDETSFKRFLFLSKLMDCIYSRLSIKVLVKNARKEFKLYILKFLGDLIEVHSI